GTNSIKPFLHRFNMRISSSICFAILAALLAVSSSCDALFDLYIPRAVMQQVIKTFNDAKVYYVYNGTVNRYALKFKIQIPAHIDRLHFSWINRSKQKLFYNIGFSVGNQLAMDQPQLNISSTGFLPNSVSGFEVSLPCTGAVQSEVTLALHINVTSLDTNRATSLSILRSKVCPIQSSSSLSASAASAAASAAAAAGSPDRQDHQSRRGADIAGERTSDSSDGGSAVHEIAGLSGRAFALLLTCSGLSLALVGGLTAVYCFRARRRSRQLRNQLGRRRLRQLPNGSGAAGCSQVQRHQRLQHCVGLLGNFSKTETGSQTSGYTSCSLPSHQRFGGSCSPNGESRQQQPAEQKPAAVAASERDLLRELCIPWDRITLKCILMEGHYSRVYRGSMKSITRDAEDEVLIKTVSDAAHPDQIAEFVHQAVTMCDLQHPNLSCVLAASRIPGDPRPHLVYSYPTEGNLKLYLMRCRGAQATSAYCVLSTQQLIGMASQLVRGLQYLHRKRFVHGDVACRNCVLTSDYTVKLADPGLSRDLFPEDYEVFRGPADRQHPISLPLRWMPPEASAASLADPAADVWSLGVSLWELITRCQQPFAEVPPALLHRRLLEGCRLAKPANCPNQLYSIMSSCWHPEPQQRPRLPQIQVEIEEFSSTLRSYV
ncbi:hypothetical protein BOX15_Mlig019426g2, partial [Macrostomum lignano]